MLDVETVREAAQHYLDAVCKRRRREEDLSEYENGVANTKRYLQEAREEERLALEKLRSECAKGGAA